MSNQCWCSYYSCLQMVGPAFKVQVDPESCPYLWYWMNMTDLVKAKAKTIWWSIKGYCYFWVLLPLRSLWNWLPIKWQPSLDQLEPSLFLIVHPHSVLTWDWGNSSGWFFHAISLTTLGRSYLSTIPCIFFYKRSSFCSCWLPWFSCMRLSFHYRPGLCKFSDFWPNYCGVGVGIRWGPIWIPHYDSW